MAAKDTHAITGVRSYLSNRFGGRGVLLSGVILIALFFLSVLPMFVTFAASFLASGPVIFSEFTLRNWELAYEQVGGVIFNTLVFAIGSAILTTALAVFIGWAIARTNVPFGRLYYYLVFGMLFLPPIVWESVWLRLLGESGLYTWLLPFSFDIHSLQGMVLVQAFHMLPMGLIVLMPTFTNMDNSLEEASRMNGGGVLRTTRKITLPLVKPGILSAFLLVLVISLGSLRVPLMIGLPESIYVLSNSIYSAVQEAPIEFGVAMADGVILILMAVPVFFFYRKAIGNRGKYGTVSGQGFSSAPIQLTRRSRYLLSGIIGFILLIVTVIPTLLMIYGSLLPYQYPIQRVFTDSHPGFSFDAYPAVMTDSFARAAVIDSFTAAVIGSLLLVIGAVTLSWVIDKSDLPFRSIIDYLSFLPLALTSVSLAIALMAIYLELIPIGIYGTIAILVVAYVTRYLPGTVRAVSPAVNQISDSLLESAEMAGMSKLGRVRTIIAPLVLSSVHAIGAMRFALLFKELPITLLLQTPDNRLLGAYLFELSLHANFAELFAVGTLVSVFLITITLLIHQIGSTTEGAAVGY